MRIAGGIRVEARTEGQSNACCERVRILAFVRSLARSSFHCGQSIAMNSCECSTTNTHSPSFVYPNGIIALRC